MSVFAVEPDIGWDGTSDEEYTASLVAQDQAGDNGEVTAVEKLRARLMTSDELDKLPAPVPLIEGVLWSDTLTELWGKPGSTKSFLAIDWALCVATGKTWQGHRVQTGRVLYIVGEGVAGIGKRRRAWTSAWQRTDTSNITWLRGAVPFAGATAWIDALEQVVDELRPALIIVDTLSRAIAGHNENAPETMSSVVAAADRVRSAAHGACVLFVHHATKDGATTRGHSALEGACDVRWKVTKDGPTITLSNPKSKDDAEAPDRDFALRVIETGGTDIAGNPITSCVIESHGRGTSVDELTRSEERLVAVMRDSFGTTGATPAQLLEVSAVARSSFYRALNALVSRDIFLNTGTKKRPHYLPAPNLPETPDEQ